MDLGTTSVQVAVRGRGIVLEEPSVVAVDRRTGKILEVGQAARQMLGRTPGELVAVRPLEQDRCGWKIPVTLRPAYNSFTDKILCRNSAG